MCYSGTLYNGLRSSSIVKGFVGLFKGKQFFINFECRLVIRAKGRVIASESRDGVFDPCLLQMVYVRPKTSSQKQV